MIVSPRFQRQAVAPWLVRQLVEASPARSFRLNATEVSRRLFSCLGFEPTGQRVYRNRGRVRRPTDAVAVANVSLAQAGLVVAETLAAMSLGEEPDMPGRLPQGQPRTFALASPALG